MVGAGGEVGNPAESTRTAAVEFFRFSTGGAVRRSMGGQKSYGGWRVAHGRRWLSSRPGLELLVDSRAGV